MYLPTHPLPFMLLLLDGPLFALLSLRDDLNPFSFAIEGYLIDGTAIWGALPLLACISPLPLLDQRGARISFMAVALVVTTSLFWSYIKKNIWGDWPYLILLLAGIAETSLAFFPLARKDDIIHQSDGSIIYI